MILLARLTNKAEQREKYKRARDQRPAKYLEVAGRHRVIPPNKACDLVDLGIVTVQDSPARPRHDTQLRIGHDVKRPQRNGPKYLNEGNSHQADVSTTICTWN
jgi:hypothetical protein